MLERHDRHPRRMACRRVGCAVPLLKRWRTWRVAIGVYALVLLIVIVMSVHVSTLALNFGSVMYGTRTVWRGHPAVFRVVALTSKQFTMVEAMRARITLRDGHGRALSAAEGVGPVAQISVPVLADAETPVHADVDVHTDMGDDHFSVPLEVVHTPGPANATWRRAGDHDHLWLPRHRPEVIGPYHVDLFAHGGTVIAGLPNRLIGRIMRHGVPQQIAVHNAALQLHTQTDTWGLFAWTYTPRPDHGPLQFQLGNMSAPLGTVTWPIRSVPQQLWVETFPRALVQAGDPLRIAIHTLPYRQPIAVDLMLGNVLIQSERVLPQEYETTRSTASPVSTTSTVSLASPASTTSTVLTAAETPQPRWLNVRVPDDATGWMLISAYRHALMPQESNAQQWVWVMPRAATHQALAAKSAEAFAWVRQADPSLVPSQAALVNATDDAHQMLLALALTRLVPNSIGAPLLHATLETRQRSFTQRQSWWRHAINTSLLVLLGLGLFGMATVMITQQRVVQRNVQNTLREAIAANELEDSPGVHQVTSIKQTAPLILALLTLLVFGYCVYMLLSTLRWE